MTSLTRTGHPLVSVVVPAYNHEHLIQGALDSVAAQSWPALELIVIDDRSRDGTAAAIDRTLSGPGFRHRFARIEFQKNQHNLGADGSINRGLALARGEFIAILNSDDRYAPERLSALCESLTSVDGQLGFTGVRMIDGEGRDITEEDWLAMQLSHMQRSIGGYPSVGWSALRHNVAISTGNLFFRRALLERIGNFKPLRYCHDWDFLLRSVLQSEPVYLPAPLYEYRIHETNSFRALGAVADEESSAVLRDYFAAVRRGGFQNALAPAPQTWPGVFEPLMTMMGFWRHWQLALRGSGAAGGQG